MIPVCASSLNCSNFPRRFDVFSVFICANPPTGGRTSAVLPPTIFKILLSLDERGQTAAAQQPIFGQPNGVSYVTMMLFLSTLVLAALLIAWLVNTLIEMLSGEKPQSTVSLWGEIVSRLLIVSEFGLIGRILNHVGLTGLPRKAVLFVGLLCILLFFLKSNHHHTNTNPTQILITNYPAQTR
jgi:hypothetical protein